MNLTKEQVKELEFEELPKYAKIDLTRLVRSTIDDNYFLGLRFVNMKETVLGKRITEPVFDEFGESLSSSLTMFVISSIENIFNGLETSEIVELLFDYIQSNLIQTNYINNIFKEYEIPILFQTDRQDHLRIEVESLKENSVSEQEHSNIKNLYQEWIEILQMMIIPEFYIRQYQFMKLWLRIFLEIQKFKICL